MSDRTPQPPRPDDATSSPSLGGEETRALIRSVLTADNHALAKLLERYSSQLLGLIRYRMDRRLNGRVDPTDVLQEAFIDASRRLSEYAESPEMPFPVWLRFLALQRLTALHRFHLGAKLRDAGKERSLDHGWAQHSESMAVELAGNFTSPSHEAIREELQSQLHTALEQLAPLDREVLRLRHFEELTNDEVAELLGITKSGASNRYIRALRRLKDVVESIPGLGDATRSDEGKSS
ncbi:MAG: sigma-70 family RNA polymerase sigma factor [Planctomycetota bacterium]